jgi:hypothetical protein
LIQIINTIYRDLKEKQRKELRKYQTNKGTKKGFTLEHLTSKWYAYLSNGLILKACSSLEKTQKIFNVPK